MGNCVGGYRFKEDEFEGLFIEFYLVNKFIPTTTELSSYGLPTTATIRRRYNMSFNEFLDFLGLPKNKKSTSGKSDDEMLNDLQLLEKELGRTPITSDLVGREDVCGKETYATRFGSWTNALRLAGIEPVWRPISSKEMIKELRRFYEENGRSPTTRDKLKFGWATINTRFGSWNNALTEAGLPHNESIFGIKTRGKDGHLYDSISESIIADWLYDNEIEYESHVPYFNSLEADFKVGDYYIEFFGMPTIPEYAAKMNIKRALCRRKGYKLIEILPDDLSSIDDKLSFLKGVTYNVR